MGFQVGQTLRAKINRISDSGNAIVQYNSQDINLGPIPHIQNTVKIEITDVSSYTKGKLRFHPGRTLTLTPTSHSTAYITNSQGMPESTFLNLGPDLRAWVLEPLKLNTEVTITFGSLNSETVRGYVVPPINDEGRDTGTTNSSSKSTRKARREKNSNSENESRVRNVNGVSQFEGRDQVNLGEMDISKLVNQLNDFPSRNRKRYAPGGRVREKYTCKCCGTRVDTGTHQCEMCQQAGCSPWKRQCEFKID